MQESKISQKRVIPADAGIQNLPKSVIPADAGIYSSFVINADAGI
jgi:hypothetical protein